MRSYSSVFALSYSTKSHNLFSENKKTSPRTSQNWKRYLCMKIMEIRNTYWYGHFLKNSKIIESAFPQVQACLEVDNILVDIIKNNATVTTQQIARLTHLNSKLNPPTDQKNLLIAGYVLPPLRPACLDEVVTTLSNSLFSPGEKTEVEKKDEATCRMELRGTVPDVSEVKLATDLEELLYGYPVKRCVIL